MALLGPSAAETLPQALSSAYSSNPEINSARAATRAADENVPIAKAGLRPIVSAFSTVTGEVVDLPGTGTIDTLDAVVGLQVEQNLFRGFRVRNAIRASEASVLASRELLRNTVQNVLLDAAQAYMDVLRDNALLGIRRANVSFLEEQVRGAQERFDVGENTRTDVAQTRARLAVARADVSLAEANLATSRAVYRQIVGHDPAGLSDGFPYKRLIPAALEQAIIKGVNDHPVIHASIHQADAEAFRVKQVEGELLPSVTLEGRIEHLESFNTSIDPNSASLIGRLSIPIYQGGSVSARVRQAKEQYGLRKIEIDLARDQVRTAVVSAWAQVEAAREAILAAGEGITAAETALGGVQEELSVGQRTQLDVLDAQQELLGARETLVVAKRNEVVASFALLSAMGQLGAEELRLAAAVYEPEEHYQAVKDKWYGVRTPDAR